MNIITEQIETEIKDNHLNIYLIGDLPTIDLIETLIKMMNNSVNKINVVFKDYQLFDRFQEHNLIYVLQKAKKLKNIFVLDQSDNSHRENKQQYIHFVQSLSQIEQFIKQEDSINSFEGQQMNELGLPIILDKLLSYFNNNMHHEGLFRKCALNSDIQSLLSEILTYNFDSLVQADPHLVACTVKQFLSQLSHPIISTDLVFQPQINLLGVINELSYVNSRVLNVMISFFLEIAKHENQNKMNIKSLSMLIAPCLVRVPTDASTLTNFTKSIGFIQKMMESFNLIAPNFDYKFFLSDYNQQNIVDEEEQSDDQLIEDWNRICQQRRNIF